MTTPNDLRDDDREADPEFRSTRMVAVIAVMAAGVVLENGFVGNLPYFAIGVVLFVVGVLAIRAPQIFWTPGRTRARPAKAAPRARSEAEETSMAFPSST